MLHGNEAIQPKEEHAMSKTIKPFVSYNQGHDRNDKAPKWKQSGFEIEGVKGTFEIAVWEKQGKDGKPYLILKVEDAVAAELRAHEYRMEVLRNKSEEVA